MLAKHKNKKSVNKPLTFHNIAKLKCVLLMVSIIVHVFCVFVCISVCTDAFLSYAKPPHMHACMCIIDCANNKMYCYQQLLTKLAND